ncbi:hypothetical protein ACM66T_10280 [Sulfurimonas sp. ST-25]|uniref:hypothetical protein n=1 Tax=Sulfurimonas sp. ST-25 TaxID=3400151 RepID=UPI003A835C83
MATAAEKTERRYRIIKWLLAYGAVFGMAVLYLLYKGIDVSKVEWLGTAVLATTVAPAVLNWFSKPPADDSALQ